MCVRVYKHYNEPLFRFLRELRSEYISFVLILHVFATCFGDCDKCVLVRMLECVVNFHSGVLTTSSTVGREEIVLYVYLPPPKNK